MRQANCLFINISCLILLVATSVGCQKKAATIPVNGKVVYKGKPLEYGSVMFQPSGGGPIARGTIASDGSFTLTTEKENDGAVPGEHQIRITSFEAQKSAIQTRGEPTLGKSAIPQKYNSFGSSGLTESVSEDMKLPLVIELSD